MLGEALIKYQAGALRGRQPPLRGVGHNVVCPRGETSPLLLFFQRSLGKRQKTHKPQVLELPVCII